MTRYKWQEIIKQEYTDENSLKYQYLLNKFKEITNKKIRILVIILYLFGARISEICNYSKEKKVKKAKRYEEDQYVTLNNGEKLIVKYAGEVIKANGKTVYELTKTDQEKLLGVRPIDFKFVDKEKDGKNYTFFQCTLRNEKNKKNIQKICYAPYWIEKDLIDEVVEYFKGFDAEQVLFPSGRRNYYHLMKKYANHFHYLHFLRALRCCVLIFVYGFNEFDIMDFMGWTDTRPLKAYKFLISLLHGMHKMITNGGIN